MTFLHNPNSRTFNHVDINVDFVTKHLLLMRNPSDVCAMLLCRHIWIKIKKLDNQIKFADLTNEVVKKNIPVLNTCWFFWQEGKKPLSNRTWLKLTKKVLTLHLHLKEVFQGKDNLLEALNAPTSPASSRPHLGMVSVFVRYPRTPDLSYSSLVMLIVVHNL